MFLLRGDAKYVDVLERILYNGFLSGVSQDGERAGGEPHGGLEGHDEEVGHQDDQEHPPDGTAPLGLGVVGVHDATKVATSPDGVNAGPPPARPHP